MGNRKTGRPAVCAHCGASFLSYRCSVRYCSRTCAGRSGRKLSGPANPRYNGGMSTWQGRTIIVTRDGSSMLYSRALMAGHLGRLLKPSEIVHHINGDPTDDRIENLQLVTRAEHIDIHRQDLLAARRIAKAAA